jgi:hypothetical protein
MMIKRFISLFMVFILVIIGPSYSFAASNGTIWSNAYISADTLLVTKVQSNKVQ